MIDFLLFWERYAPEPQFYNRKAATCSEWQKCSEDRQQTIMDWLQDNRPPAGRNPFFFIQDFDLLQPHRQTLSFRDYYARFGTTEEQPGWHMVTPKTGNVYYEHL